MTPDDFPYLGVLTFEPGKPNQIRRITKTFYILRLVARGVVGGKRRAINQSNLDLFCYAKDGGRETLLIGASISFGNYARGALTIRRFDRTTNDGIVIEDNFLKEMRHNFLPESLTQLILHTTNS